jgi:hypothetical protein
MGMRRFAAADSPRPFRRQRFRHGDVSPRPFRRHLNLITAVMIDSIFTEYATHISRNLNFILDPTVYTGHFIYTYIIFNSEHCPYLVLTFS